MSNIFKRLWSEENAPLMLVCLFNFSIAQICFCNLKEHSSVLLSLKLPSIFFTYSGINLQQLLENPCFFTLSIHWMMLCASLQMAILMIFSSNGPGLMYGSIGRSCVPSETVGNQRVKAAVTSPLLFFLFNLTIFPFWVIKLTFKLAFLSKFLISKAHYNK